MKIIYILILTFLIFNSQNFNINDNQSKPFNFEKNKYYNQQNRSHYQKLNQQKTQYDNSQNSNNSNNQMFKQIIDQINKFTSDENLQKVIYTRIEAGQFQLQFYQIIDLPAQGAFSENFKNVVQGTHRIGQEFYNHVYVDKPYFPAWIQKLLWIAQSLVASTSDIQVLDMRFYQAELFFPETFTSLYDNLIKLIVSGFAHGMLSKSNTIDFEGLIGTVWFTQQMQQRVGFGSDKDRGTGFANLFIPGSVHLVGDSVIAMNERSVYSMVGTLAESFFTLFVADQDDSTEDWIDEAHFWKKFFVYGSFNLGFAGLFAYLIISQGAFITDLDLGEFATLPWYQFMFVTWNISNAIGLGPTPTTLRDQVFMICYLYSNAKAGGMFNQAVLDLMQIYLPYNASNVALLFVFNIFFYIFLMDYTNTFALLAAPTLDGILNSIANAIFNGQDLGTTTGRGDCFAGDDIKYILMIPQFYLWSYILTQVQQNTNHFYDEITSQLIYHSIGVRDEQFYSGSHKETIENVKKGESNEKEVVVSNEQSNVENDESLRQDQKIKEKIQEKLHQMNNKLQEKMDTSSKREVKG